MLKEKKANKSFLIKKELNSIINNLTIEQKIGQLFIIGLPAANGQHLKEINNETIELINTYSPGGFILFDGNFESIDQIVNLINDLQNTSLIPFFIATDEEGGRISRMANSVSLHATHFPEAEIIGNINDPYLAFKAGRVIGSELRSLGINMNFAPVADLNTNPENVVIGSRAYGSYPYETGYIINAIVRGLQYENVSSVIKHFPGHGDTQNDTHYETAIVNNSIERLESLEFIPFKMGIEAGAEGVMTAHIILASVLEEKLPATFSSYILKEQLRNKLNHNKLIITDAMNMGSISNNWSSGEASKLAFIAGADIILIPDSLEDSYNSILSAVISGEISETRINESVKRILYVKYIRNILNSTYPEADPESVLGCVNKLKVLREISEYLKKD